MRRGGPPPPLRESEGAGHLSFTTEERGGDEPGSPDAQDLRGREPKGRSRQDDDDRQPGRALAELDWRVLVLDLDPQGNATTGLGIEARSFDNSIYDVLLHDFPIEDCIEPTSLKNLFIVPATLDLAGAEIELVPAMSRELRLRRAVETLDDGFDFVLIDCPPSLGLITVNGLAAASEVLVPIQCEYYALEGLGQLLRSVELVRANLNPDLDLSTIVLTMYDSRTRSDQVANEVRSQLRRQGLQDGHPTLSAPLGGAVVR